MKDTLQIRQFPKWNLHRFTANCFIKTFNEKSKYFAKIIEKSLLHDVTLSYQLFVTTIPKHQFSIMKRSGHQFSININCQKFVKSLIPIFSETPCIFRNIVNRIITITNHKHCAKTMCILDKQHALGLVYHSFWIMRTIFQTHFIPKSRP